MIGSVSRIVIGRWRRVAASNMPFQYAAGLHWALPLFAGLAFVGLTLRIPPEGTFSEEFYAYAAVAPLILALAWAGLLVFRQRFAVPLPAQRAAVIRRLAWLWLCFAAAWTAALLIWSGGAPPRAKLFESWLVALPAFVVPARVLLTLLVARREKLRLALLLSFLPGLVAIGGLSAVPVGGYIGGIILVVLALGGLCLASFVLIWHADWRQRFRPPELRGYFAYWVLQSWMYAAVFTVAGAFLLGLRSGISSTLVLPYAAATLAILFLLPFHGARELASAPDA